MHQRILTLRYNEGLHGFAEDAPASHPRRDGFRCALPILRVMAKAFGGTSMSDGGGTLRDLGRGWYRIEHPLAVSTPLFLPSPSGGGAGGEGEVKPPLPSPPPPHGGWG